MVSIKMSRRDLKNKRKSLALCAMTAFVLVSPQFSFSIERIYLNEVRASFVGKAEWDVVGWSICAAGDINGDGFDDVLISTSNDGSCPTEGGQTFVYFGKSLNWHIREDLSNADASFIGEKSNDGALTCVSSDGDVNGDGYDDILIGAIYSDNGGYINYNCGQTYLVFGKPSGWAMHANLFGADASFVGMEGQDWTGWTLSIAGDVNGDGYDDIIIGAFAFDPVRPGAEERPGRAYLVFGKPNGWSMRTPLSEADVTFVGSASKDWSGSMVSGAGDVNGDGYGDILIAAHWKDKNGQDVSRVYIFFGRATGWDSEMPLSDADLTLNGPGWFSPSLHWDYWPGGWSVAGAGDVNGDGLDDMLIGCAWDGTGGNLAGQTFLVLGRTGDWGGREVDLTAVADASFIGEKPGDWSGFRVAGGGDVNGDGYADMLIAAYRCSNEAGQTYLILGKPDGWAKGASLSTADISFIGEARGDRSGFSLSINGDVSGDGYDDILIGAPYNDYTATDAGQTYLQFKQEQKGDVNFDGEINIVDVVLAVNMILETIVDPLPGWLWAADYNGDGTINMLDVIQIVNIILGK